MTRDLRLPHGQLRLPVFLPDATFGVVRAVDSADLIQCGVQALVMNTFHLMQRPGSSTIKALGGLHTMCHWPGPIVTDSGGFQAYSLIRQHAQSGQLTNKGIVFKPEGSVRKFHLTPEKTVQLQVSYDADVVICLDDCTHVDDPLQVQQASVKRTIDWAKRCKQEFDRLVQQKEMSSAQRPLLFAVIQGGGSQELRTQCASELLTIGFDGFGYGGWPLDGEGHLLADLLAYTKELIPPEFPLHALGVGHPENVMACARMGYGLFDSSMPTRDARHGRLYTFTVDSSSSALTDDWFAYIYIQDDKHIKADRPVSPFCDCACCANYSLGYLHHLFEVKESLYQRLATIHNLRFMNRLMDYLQARL
jgi:queuine tRNA-ribosyltransferase